MTKFAEMVQKEMDNQGLTKADIAAACSIADSTVRGWWAKNTTPAADTAYKVAEFLEVSLEYLITGKTEHNARELSQQDKAHLATWHLLSEEQQKTVNTFIEQLAFQNQREKNII